MAKKVTGYLKLQVPAGAANPSPPIGPALGQRGLNIMEFCKSFNAQTQKEEKNTPIPVVITIYADRSFTFEMKTPPMSFFIKKAAKLTSGSKLPGRDKAGAANPSPPIGPALGQRGLNIMEFCKAFNAQTQKIEKATPIPVVITIYADRSFTFELKTPPMSFFIKKAADLKSGSKLPGRDKAGSVTKAQVREIAETKMKDLNCDTIEAAMKMVEGSARSMGVEVAG